MVGKTFVGALAMVVVLVSSLLAGCRGGGGGGGAQAEWAAQAMRLNDSVRSHAASTPALADSLLAAAPDSTAFHEANALRGHYLLNCGKADSAIAVARRTQRFALGQPASPRNNGLLALGYSLEAAACHSTRHHTEESINLYAKSLDLFLQSDKKEASPNTAANLADAYILLNDIPTAARFYRRALFLADSLHMPDEASISIYMGLGQIYTTLEDYESARHYYEQTDRLFDKMEPNIQAYFLNNYGNYHYFKGDYANALRTFKRMLALVDGRFDGNDYMRALCRVNMADVYLNLCQTDSALAFAALAEPTFRRLGVGDGLFYVNTIRMGAALRRRDYKRAGQLANDTALPHSTDFNMLAIRSRYLAELHSATGNYEAAYRTYRESRERVDSAEHNKQNMRASEIMSRLSEDTLRLHFALEMGRKDAEVAQSRASLYLTLFVLAVVVMGGVIAWNVQRKRKAQTELDMFMLRLATMRQRISPHFVFNVINAKLGNAPREEGDQLVSMAKLIRQNLELTGKTFVPLSEEMAFVERYVALQGSLVSGGISYEAHLPEDPCVLEAITIPSMFVQILVENAIKHGLRNAKGDKRLTIDISVTDRLTTITVADTGPGFDIRRRGKDSTRTGLSVIRGTMAVVNKNNKRGDRMAFDIGNTLDPEGRIAGCRATLTVPRGMKTP